MKFSHLDSQGEAHMVNTSAKSVQRRTAMAEGRLRCRAETLAALQENAVPKGNVLTVAKIAGIQAAKRTDELIPLCHSLPLDGVEILFALETDSILITATATTHSRTGVEMEALTAVTVAALTIYDMCKAVDKTMVIDGVHLVAKQKQ